MRAENGSHITGRSFHSDSVSSSVRSEHRFQTLDLIWMAAYPIEKFKKVQFNIFYNVIIKKFVSYLPISSLIFILSKIGLIIQFQLVKKKKSFKYDWNLF